MQATQWNSLTTGAILLHNTVLAACAPTHTPAATPVRIIDITSGSSHTCLLLPGGQIRCWGLNDSGQLGDGTLTNQALPEGVIDMMMAAKGIAAGERHTCPVTMQGGLK